MTNLIQIKRSLNTSVPASLANGELAFTANGDILYIGSNGNVEAIGGKRNPGILTANQALVANSTSGLDKIIVANLQPTYIYANGASGSSGQVLSSNSTGGVFWETPSAGVAGSNTQIQFNDSDTLAGDSDLTFDKTTGTLSTNNILATSIVNAATLSVGTAVVVNSTIITLDNTVGLTANGSTGINGQVLTSNGSAVYWKEPFTGTIENLTAGVGLISNSSGVHVLANSGIIANSSGTFADAANGISVTSDGINVLANSGIIANSSGTFADAANGISVTSDGINVIGGDGLISNTSGVYVGAGDGISVAADSVSVIGGEGLISNTSGVHVGAGNGIAVDADSIRVVDGTGVTSNSTGVHIGQDVATTASVTFANVVTSNLSVTGTVSSNLMPLANNTYHIGNTTIKWAQIHAANVHGDTGIFDGNLEVAGDLIVTGNVTTANVSSLIVGDAKILLAANNPGDILDIGFSGTYVNGGSTVRHAGLFRDASDNGVFKFFTNTTQDLTGNNVIDTDDATYEIGTLQSYLVSSGLFSNSSVTNITANSTVSVAITANTLSLTTALAGTSGGTGKTTITDNALLIGNSSNGYDELTLGTTGQILQSNGTALVYDTLDGGTF